jgi:L-alanine-DL-glutamate epimerase-like enolase superfamily enzyme
VPHGGCLVPSLHAAAAGSSIEMVEYHLLLEPARQAHLAEPVRPRQGPFLSVPERPGWAGPLGPQVLGGHDE